jgi:hypothetical protein
LRLFCQGSTWSRIRVVGAAYEYSDSICKRPRRSVTRDAAQASSRVICRNCVLVAFGAQIKRPDSCQYVKSKSRRNRMVLLCGASRGGQKLSAAKTSIASRRSATFTPTARPLQHNRNGFTNTLHGRPPRTASVNTAPSTANHPSPTRDTPQATKTPLHLHAAHNPVRRKLIHTTHDKPAARIQEREGHKECAIVESQLAEAAERGGGRGRTTGRFPCQVRQRLGHRRREGV